ncbi:MAG: hypothetical protein KA100_00200 [Rickettsiales bacterium]|nr:hypothetical protein [Rickettsiales bacterium]
MEIQINDYQKILAQVQKTIQETEQNIVQSVNRQKVLMSWQIGKIVEQHLLKNKRAEYGKKLFSQLAQDTKIKEKVLYQMRSFYKTYPTLPKEEKDLSWSHYRSLASVKSEETRKYLEELTVKNQLGSNELQQQIAKSKPRSKKASAPKKLTFERGKLFAYKLVEEEGETLVDCGFNIFSEVKTSLKAEGQIVESSKKGDAFSLKKSALTPRQIYTYKARLDRVVDGDTIHVTLDLGFKIKHKEILRLAKISAEEAETFGGKKATAALKTILKDAPFLIVKTNKTDIYGRYIADIFFGEKSETDPQKVADSGIYLNQLLLDRGLVEPF